MEAGKQSLRVVPNRTSPGLVHFIRENDYVFMEKRIRAKLSIFNISLEHQELAIDKLGITRRLAELNTKVQANFVVPIRSVQRVQIVDEQGLAKTLAQFCLQLHRTLARAPLDLQIQEPITAEFEEFVAADTMADLIRWKFEVEQSIPISELKDIFGQPPSAERDDAVNEVFCHEIARSPLPRYSVFRNLIASINSLNRSI